MTLAQHVAEITCPTCNGCCYLASRTANMFNGQVVSSSPSRRVCEDCEGTGMKP